jgi:hypothetical protein
MMMTKKILLSFFVVFFSINYIAFFFDINTASADTGRIEKPLEIKYPGFGGLKPETVKTPIPQYAKYIFYFLLGVSGLIALGSLITAGFNYLSSAGDPTKISDAKDRITAVILGLIIIITSVLIVRTINPQLIIFNIKGIRPILSSLRPGVLLCKKSVDVDEAWALQEEYKDSDPNNLERQQEINDQLELILEDISKNCYTVLTQGDIEVSFDNKITDIYFIPQIWAEGDWIYESEYGAILYEERSFGGYSHPYYGHLIATDGGWQPYHRVVGLQASSVKPFQLIYEPDENWSVRLYEKPNLDQGFLDLKVSKIVLGEGSWWTEIPINFSWWNPPDKSPESIKVEGDLIAVLWKRQDGENDSFYNETDNNLLDNYNIVNWEPCIEHLIRGCAVAASKFLAVLAARIY